MSLVFSCDALCKAWTSAPYNWYHKLFCYGISGRHIPVESACPHGYESVLLIQPGVYIFLSGHSQKLLFDCPPFDAVGVAVYGAEYLYHPVWIAIGAFGAGGYHSNPNSRTDFRHVAAGKFTILHQDKKISADEKGAGRDLDSGCEPAVLDLAVLSGVGQLTVPDERAGVRGDVP